MTREMKPRDSRLPDLDITGPLSCTGLMEAWGRRYERIAEACLERRRTPEPAVESDGNGVCRKSARCSCLHAVAIADPEHDLSLLAETQPVLLDVLELMKTVDKDHYDGLFKLVAPPVAAAVAAGSLSDTGEVAELAP